MSRQKQSRARLKHITVGICCIVLCGAALLFGINIHMKQITAEKMLSLEEAAVDSMYRAKEIFCAKRVLVVSQAYHLPRAVYIAERLGLEAYGVAAEDILYRGQSYRECREMLARAKDFCQAWLKLKPKYLGEQIPIYGNGTATNG